MKLYLPETLRRASAPLGMTFAIRYSLFTIRYSLFAIHYSLFNDRRLRIPLPHAGCIFLSFGDGSVAP